MNTERPDYVFDGCGINGPDEYRERIATLTPAARKSGIGKKMALALNAHDELIALIARVYKQAAKDEWDRMRIGCEKQRIFRDIESIFRQVNKP